MSNLSTLQPPPIHTDTPAVWDLVIADMHERDRVGAERYGTRLQVENGRDSLVDAYQESLDLVAYLRQEIERRKVYSFERLVAERVQEMARAGCYQAIHWSDSLYVLWQLIDSMSKLGSIKNERLQLIKALAEVAAVARLLVDGVVK